MTPPKDKLEAILPVQARAIDWLAVCGNVHLALRHPLNTGASDALARQVCEQILDRLLEDGTLTPDERASFLRDELNFEAPSR